MNIGTIARESAAVVCVTVAACATAKVGNDLGNIVKKAVHVAAEKMCIYSAFEWVLGFVPGKSYIEEGFELLTQKFFVRNIHKLSAELVKSTAKNVAATLVLNALVYKVAHNSRLVNAAVTVLSGATRAVASRIV